MGTNDHRPIHNPARKYRNGPPSQAARSAQDVSTDRSRLPRRAGEVLATEDCDAEQATAPLPTVAELLEELAGVDDEGTIKLNPGNDGKSWYCVYTWRWGEWRGHYVMAVVNRGYLCQGLVLLSKKVKSVRLGLRTPSLDRYTEH